MDSVDVKPSNPAHIKGAALLYSGAIFWMPAPFRHGHVIHAFAECGFVRNADHSRMEQGFVSWEGKFLPRLRAAQIHIRRGGKLHWPPNLYSEDLW